MTQALAGLWAYNVCPIAPLCVIMHPGQRATKIWFDRFRSACIEARCLAAPGLQSPVGTCGDIELARG
eukprot:547377-Alexandrium_andersonii.AAC.1